MIADGLKKIIREEGFTLAEIIVVVVIFLLCFSGILVSFLKCMELSEMSRNSSFAISAVNSRMEQIKNTPFNQIYSNFNNVTFTSGSLTGIGVSYVDISTSDITYVTISFCWSQKNGRVIGEDKNLNGVLDSGEDLNANGLIDSPVEVVSAVYNG